jgi:signal transduction histidine kinase
VQESLHNIVKHAHASTVNVKLDWNDVEITLDVRDDGVGFDTSGSFPGHMGLKSMRERTVKFGGLTTIESAPGDGTRIRVRIPLGGRILVAAPGAPAPDEQAPESTHEAASATGSS